jgi:hypothetical protein
MAVLLLLAVLAAAVLASSLLLRWNEVRYSRRRGLPPGTMGWPLFGETTEFLKQGPSFMKARRLRYPFPPPAMSAHSAPGSPLALFSSPTQSPVPGAEHGRGFELCSRLPSPRLIGSIIWWKGGVVCSPLGRRKSDPETRRDISARVPQKLAVPPLFQLQGYHTILLLQSNTSPSSISHLLQIKNSWGLGGPQLVSSSPPVPKF